MLCQSVPVSQTDVETTFLVDTITSSHPSIHTLTGSVSNTVFNFLSLTMCVEIALTEELKLTIALKLSLPWISISRGMVTEGRLITSHSSSDTNSSSSNSNSG